MENKFAHFLKTKRTEAGLTQQQVAADLGYASPQFISNWERGISYPPIPTLKQLAKLYSISAEDMCDAMIDASIEDVTRSLRAKFNNSDKKIRSV